MTNTPATTPHTIISLIKVGHLLTKQLNKSLVRTFNFTFNQVFVLFHVAHCPAQVTPKQLADTLLVSLPNVTAMLKRLQAEDYLTQTQSQTDRRQYVLSVTAKGRKILKRIQTAWPPNELKNIDETLKQLPKTKQLLLAQTLNDLLGYLKEQ